MGALLGIARSEPNLARRVAHHERMLHETRNSLYGRVSLWQQDAMSARLTNAFRHLGSNLERVGRPTAAWFWRREGAWWSTRPRSTARTVWSAGPLDTEVADAALSVGNEVAEGDVADGGTNAQLAWLVRKIAAENAPGVVLTVMAMVTDSADIEILQSATQIIDDWHPGRRCSRPGRLEPAKRRTADDFRRSLLEDADEVAAGYAAYLRPELLNKLARQAALGSAERLAVAEEALAVSLEAARWTEASEALRVFSRSQWTLVTVRPPHTACMPSAASCSMR